MPPLGVGGGEAVMPPCGYIPFPEPQMSQFPTFKYGVQKFLRSSKRKVHKNFKDFLLIEKKFKDSSFASQRAPLLSSLHRST